MVVVLLWPVALLNYLDRQMLAAMKYSVMAGIPSIGTEASWGFEGPSTQYRKYELVAETLGKP